MPGIRPIRWRSVRACASARSRPDRPATARSRSGVDRGHQRDEGARRLGHPDGAVEPGDLLVVQPVAGDQDGPGRQRRRGLVDADDGGVGADVESGVRQVGVERQV